MVVIRILSADANKWCIYNLCFEASRMLKSCFLAYPLVFTVRHCSSVCSNRVSSRILQYSPFGHCLTDNKFPQMVRVRLVSNRKSSSFGHCLTGNKFQRNQSTGSDLERWSWSAWKRNRSATSNSSRRTQLDSVFGGKSNEIVFQTTSSTHGALFPQMVRVRLVSKIRSLPDRLQISTKFSNF
jgi:hypothetical protein